MVAGYKVNAQKSVVSLSLSSLGGPCTYSPSETSKAGKYENKNRAISK